MALTEELLKAKTARQEGNEGRARVCARRAAGIAVREYLELRQIPASRSSAYDLLVYLQELPGISDQVRQSAQRLTTRVNQEFNLPAEIDLIEEALWLARALEEMLDQND